MLKTGKLVHVLQESSYQSSMKAYARYNQPKFKEVVQIVLMLLGKPKEEINLPRSNALDHRKCITRDSLPKLL